MLVAVPVAGSGVLRHSRRDAVLVALSGVHLALLVGAPSVAVVALGLWWNANTVAHNFIHRPFFRSRRMNRIYALFLSAVLGCPQALWRTRHLAHHADRPVRIRFSPALAWDTSAVLGMWIAWASLAPRTFLTTYLPGWALGLVLCRMQGHFEHVHGTTSHYGRLYNLLFFNDGYHVEHHLRPGLHWSRLGRWRASGRASRWPPVLRWLETRALDRLERVVLDWTPLQRFVLRAHERAFVRVRPMLADARSVLIVGGGLFPRTALVLRRVLPGASLAVLDVSPEHLARAREHLDGVVDLREGLFTGEAASVDIVVVPLAYIGDRRALYASPPARVTVVHDWIWSRRRDGVVISLLLLKRLNVVVRDRGERRQADAGA